MYVNKNTYPRATPNTENCVSSAQAAADRGTGHPGNRGKEKNKLLLSQHSQHTQFFKKGTTNTLKDTNFTRRGCSFSGLFGPQGPGRLNSVRKVAQGRLTAPTILKGRPNMTPDILKRWCEIRTIWSVKQNQTKRWRIDAQRCWVLSFKDFVFMFYLFFC